MIQCRRVSSASPEQQEVTRFEELGNLTPFRPSIPEWPRIPRRVSHPALAIAQRVSRVLIGQRKTSSVIGLLSDWLPCRSTGAFRLTIRDRRQGFASYAPGIGRSRPPECKRVSLASAEGDVLESLPHCLATDILQRLQSAQVIDQRLIAPALAPRPGLSSYVG